MQTERTVPSQQLVERIALCAGIVFLDQTAGSSLVTMVHVHIVHLQLVDIVHTEVDVQLQAFEYAELVAVRTQSDARTQAGNVILHIRLVVYQATQRVEVVIAARTSAFTIVQLRIAVGVQCVVAVSILHIHREQRRSELGRVPYVGL